MEFLAARIQPFYVEGDVTQHRARVVFGIDGAEVQYERVTDTPAEAAAWTTVAIQNVSRGLAPPGSA